MLQKVSSSCILHGGPHGTRSAWLQPLDVVEHEGVRYEWHELLDHSDPKSEQREWRHHYRAL